MNRDEYAAQERRVKAMVDYERACAAYDAVYDAFHDDEGATWTQVLRARERMQALGEHARRLGA